MKVSTDVTMASLPTDLMQHSYFLKFVKVVVSFTVMTFKMTVRVLTFKSDSA